MTLMTLKDGMDQNFLDDFPIYGQTVWPRATKFGSITRGRVACFYGVSHTPVLMGRGPSVPQNFGTSYMCARSMRNDQW